MYIIYGKDNCPYCVRAKQLLDSKVLRYDYRDVKEYDYFLQEMIYAVTEETGSPPKTVPQIFSPQGVYIGGFTELSKTFESEDLVLDEFDL